MPPQKGSGALATKIQGLREAKRAFQALPDIVRERMLDATTVTVKEIARNAKARLLSSPSIRTRALYDHIATSVTKTNGRGRVGVSAGSTTLNISGRRFKVRGILIQGKGGSALRSAGAKKIMPSLYAHFVEFGTRHSPAEPFMIPSADGEKQAYLARCRAAGKGVETDTAAIGMRTL